MRAALRRLGRPVDEPYVDGIVARLATADPGLILESIVDTDPALHRRE